MIAAGNCGFNREDGGQDNGTNPNPQCTNRTHINYPQYFSHATDLGPALANIIVVAATDNKDHIASFSDYGATTVDVGAPGVDIYSTVQTSTGIYSESFTSSTVGPSGTFSVGGTTMSQWHTGILGASLTGVYTDSTLPYGTGESTYMQSPTINLSGVHAAGISFIVWCDTPST